MARIAFFVIDIQAELAKEPETQIPHAQRIREVGTALLGRARGAVDAARSKGQKPDLEIVIVQHNESPEEGTLVKGSKPWELVFPPREGDPNERVVHKTTRKS
jgi:nicotinamidase-related amidase